MADPISNKVERTNIKNVLNDFRSYNYIFTLASLSKNALIDTSSYRENEDYFVIAKSVGKGTKGIGTDKITDPTAQQFVTDFNANSPGRFDFYMNNVIIDTIMGFDERTSLSVATKIDFEIVEPYSMSGFIEALQAAAMAAGYEQYSLTPFLLKVEFVGYPDSDFLSDKVVKVPDATRYFVFSFTGMDITVTESGARYQCKGVPHNERAFGVPSTLKSSIQIEGETVGEILKSLEKSLNESAKDMQKSEKDPNSKPLGCDVYEIRIPEPTPDGFDINKENADIANAKLIEVLKDKSVYKFQTPAASSTATTTVQYDATALKPVISFAENAKVQECIISIVRDSQYVRKMLANFPDNSTVDKYGYTPYFIVNLEVEELGTMDEEKNRPYYKYRYIVLPYKIHHSRVPPHNHKIDTSQLVTILNREYQYLYTGKNVDVKQFELKFNTLFFQAIPRALGNKGTTPSQSEGAEPTNSVLLCTPAAPFGTQKASATDTQRVDVDVRVSAVKTGKTQNAIQPQTDPYATMARNLHQAILDNVDQCTGTIEIIGDPYYLVTAGIGNYRPKNNKDNTVGEGEAPYTNRDVMILIQFKNPIDIDEKTGEAIFDKANATYSGIFRVINVLNTFKDGVFSQQLKLVRIPAQLPDAVIASTSSAPLPKSLGSRQDPLSTTTPLPAEPVSALRASSGALFASITNGLPITGLPGDLSNLVSASVIDPLKSLAGQASTLEAEALSGLSSVSSTLRLSASGLLTDASAIKTAGASIQQLTKTAESLGIANASNLSKTVSSAVDTASKAIASTSKIADKVSTFAAKQTGTASSQVDALSDAAMSKINNLGDSAAGVAAGITAKISNLNGIQTALTNSLGIDLSKLSGLSSNLQTKITEAIETATKSIPDSVDLNSAIQQGLILNNIPTNALGNIPATMPALTAPLAELNLADIQSIIDRGGNIANIPGASALANISSALDKIPTNKLPAGLASDITAIAGKVTTLQTGLTETASKLTAQVAAAQSGINVDAVLSKVQSVESTLTKVAEKLPGNVSVPNISGVASSVIAKYGSASAGSPLDTLMKTIK